MNRAYKIILSILIISCSILCMPFSYIKAESQLLAPPFLGVNINVIDVINNTRYVMRGSPEIENTNQMAWYCTARTSTGCDAWVTREPNGSTAKHNYEISFNGAYLNPTILDTNYIVELEFILDNDYVGQFQLEYNENGVGLVDQFVFVNGSSVTIKLDNFNLSNPSISVYGINLQNNSDNSYVFPIESFTTIKYVFDQGYELYGLDGHSQYIYPIFKNDPNKYFSSTSVGANGNDEWIMILGVSKHQVSNLDRFNLYFNYSSGIEFYDFKSIYVSTAYRIFSVKYKNPTSSNIQNNVYYLTSGANFMPIYINRTNVKNLTTDFAIVYGLRNEILDNLNIIAQGNQQTQTSVNTATTTNQTAQSTFQQEEQLINNQEQAMQQNLDNLDIQNKNNNLFGNSKFIASAQWVKQQFDWFTNDNAFGYLITFSLVIGLALVIVGKLRG